MTLNAAMAVRARHDYLKTVHPRRRAELAAALERITQAAGSELWPCFGSDEANRLEAALDERERQVMRAVRHVAERLRGTPVELTAPPTRKGGVSRGRTARGMLRVFLDEQRPEHRTECMNTLRAWRRQLEGRAPGTTRFAWQDLAEAYIPYVRREPSWTTYDDRRVRRLAIVGAFVDLVLSCGLEPEARTWEALGLEAPRSKSGRR